MKRNKKSQSKHDKFVERLARSYERRGYDVDANVRGRPAPDSVAGYRPDIAARKDGHTTLVEVETADSVTSNRDRAQQRAFRRWSKRKSTRHFVRRIAR